jgi:hypothetical protein
MYAFVISIISSASGVHLDGTVLDKMYAVDKGGNYCILL